MAPIQLKFVDEQGEVHSAHFPEPPSWDDLVSRVSRTYDIPIPDVGISYVDSEGDDITISSNEELSDYYTTLPQIHNHAFKLNVKDKRPKRPPRPVTDILLNLDDQWTSPLFATVPLTPSRLYLHEGSSGRIEEVLDEADELKPDEDGDDDAKSYLDIPDHPQLPEDDDDASSIESIVDDDLPDKKPIHVYGFNDGDLHKRHSVSSLSRSSTKSKSDSRSILSQDAMHQDIEAQLEAQFDIVNPDQYKSQSPRHSEFDIVEDAVPATGNHLVDPIRSRNWSRSRSPRLHSHPIPPRESSTGRFSVRSSHVTSQHPSPVIHTVETTSPRGAPASVDLRSIPSPEPITISVPPIPEESMLLEETSALTISDPDPPLPSFPPLNFSTASATATVITPSLTNDIASLLDALTKAFNEHPELSNGLRNIVHNASQGVYWNNATEAIRSIRDTVVSDALQARDVIQAESATAARDISGQAQAEAGRKIAEALGNVFRSLGTVLGARSSVPSMETTPAMAARAATVKSDPLVQSQLQQKTHGHQSQGFLGPPRPESPALIRATPLIRAQDIPPDARSLSRPSSHSSSPDRDADPYPSGSSARTPHHGDKYRYPPPPHFIPVVWGSPPPRSSGGDRNPYGPPPPTVVIPAPMHPHGYTRSRHHRSQSGAPGSGSTYPPPAGPPPPSGAYYMSPYSSSPYSYRYPQPDPRAYIDPRHYGRNGYPGVGAGANMKRSNTLPPSFPATGVPPAPAPVSEAAQLSEIPAEIPRPDQTFASLVNTMTASAAPSTVAAQSPTQSFSAAPSITATTPGPSVTVAPTSVALQKSLDDTYIELEEAKRRYKEKKEEYKKEREERKLQRERERAQRHAEREERKLARLAAVARVRGQPTPQPIPPPMVTLKQPTSGNVSGSESGTEKALPITPQRGTTGPAISTPPRRSSIERLNKEVHDRLNAMGFTTRSYPQLNTLVPINIRKHTMLLQDVPDEVIINNVLEDIFTAPIPPSSSLNKI